MLSQRYPRLHCRKSEDAGVWIARGRAFHAPIVKVYMAEDTALAEKVQKLGGVT
jgi:hypothetical protein